MRAGGCQVVIAQCQWQSTGCTCQVSWVRFPAAASRPFHLPLYCDVKQAFWTFRKPFSMGSLLMERISRSTPDGVLMATWVTAGIATEAFQYHLCSTNRGRWLSSCHSSVAENWQHKPGVLDSIPGDCRPSLFSPKFSLIDKIPSIIKYLRLYKYLIALNFNKDFWTNNFANSLHAHSAQV